jgi:hypothetical protein
MPDLKSSEKTSPGFSGQMKGNTIIAISQNAIIQLYVICRSADTNLKTSWKLGNRSEGFQVTQSIANMGDGQPVGIESY